jgi:co-chaperonin GroES (HSP10)
MRSKIVTTTSEDALAEAFPAVDAGVQPFGSRVLVQIRTPKTKTAGGIILHVESRDTEKWNTQVAKVIAVGPLAYKNRDTQASWPEGQWCKPGDFVRVPKYGGDRWEVPLDRGSREKEAAMFVIFNDLDVIGQVTGDPLAVKAFI